MVQVDFGKTKEYTNVPRPGSTRPNELRPVTDYARMKVAVGDINPRWRSSNVLQLELDMPERTTQVKPTHDIHASGVVSSFVQATIPTTHTH